MSTGKSREPARVEWRDYPLPGSARPGRIAVRVARGVASPELRTSRDLLVALPPSYTAEGRRYPVLYMQDGQNLFDPATSHAGDWGLPASLDSLADRGGQGVVGGTPHAAPRRCCADPATLRYAGGTAARVPGRIHLDVGTGEGAEAVADARALRDILVAAGYVPGRDLSYVEEEGGGHDEAAWGRRFLTAMPFLLGTTEPGT